MQSVVQTLWWSQWLNAMSRILQWGPRASELLDKAVLMPEALFLWISRGRREKICRIVFCFSSPTIIISIWANVAKVNSCFRFKTREEHSVTKEISHFKRLHVFTNTRAPGRVMKISVSTGMFRPANHQGITNQQSSRDLQNSGKRFKKPSRRRAQEIWRATLKKNVMAIHFRDKTTSAPNLFLIST